MHVGGKGIVYFSSGVLLPDEVAELRGSEVFADDTQGSGAAQLRMRPANVLMSVAVPVSALAWALMMQG
jgi:hypothetical protein